MCGMKDKWGQSKSRLTETTTWLPMFMDIQTITIPNIDCHIVQESVVVMEFWEVLHMPGFMYGNSHTD